MEKQRRLMPGDEKQAREIRAIVNRAAFRDLCAANARWTWKATAEERESRRGAMRVIQGGKT